MAGKRGFGGMSAGRPSTDKAKLQEMLRDGGGAGMKRVNFEVTQELHDKLSAVAFVQRRSIREILTEAIEKLPDPGIRR